MHKMVTKLMSYCIIFQQNTFTGIDGRTKEIDYMSMTNSFLYAQDFTASVLGIPYKNDELHMFLFLPTNPGEREH